MTSGLGRARQALIYRAGVLGRRPQVPTDFAELERRAQAAMSSRAWAYVAGGAGSEATQRAILDALEARYPMLRGTIRDQVTLQRRAFLRFFACQEDLSHEPADVSLPDAVARGEEPLMIVGAIAGG